MNIEDAAGAILDLADDLTRSLHTKGYTQSHAEIWIGRGPGRPGCVVFIDRAPAGMPFIRSGSLAETVASAIEAIAALPDKMAAAPWFTVEPVAQREEASAA